MDINLLRGLLTAVSLACFVGILWWAYSPRNRARHEEAGRLPLDE